VIAAALVVEVASMLVFLVASGVAELVLARVLQGIATGAAVGALIADLTPGRPALTAVVNTASPTLGLAVGAVASGALVQFAPDPRHLVYILLAVLFGLTLVALTIVPETTQRRPGALTSLTPRARVPRPARRAFQIVTPILLAGWAVGGVMLPLGPSLAAGIFGATSHLTGGLVVAALAGAGSITSVAVRNRDARSTMVSAALALVVGMAVVLISVGTESTAMFFVGLVITGIGFGGSFVGVLGTLVPLATPGERAELFASVYVISYLAFGLAAVLAGLAVPHLGLRPTTVVFGLVVMALALLASGAELLSRRRDDAGTRGSTAPTPTSAQASPAE
jgi:MFS family permease